MANDSPSSQTSAVLKFNTRLNEVDAGTLGHILISYGRLGEIVNAEFNSETSLDIRVTALSPGSFVVPVEMGIVSTALAVTAPLFTPENVKSATDVLKFISEFLKIKRALKDEPVSKLEKANESGPTESTGRDTYHVNGDNVVFNTQAVNLYINRPAIPREASSIGTALESDSGLDGFEIQNANFVPEFSISKDEFPLLAASNNNKDTQQTDTEVRTIREVLEIIQMSFVPDYIWRFKYNGNYIRAKITDATFYENLNAGRVGKFDVGDMFDVDLAVTLQWDEKLSTYIPSGAYEVVKFYRHIERPRDAGLFDVPEED